MGETAVALQRARLLSDPCSNVCVGCSRPVKEQEGSEGAGWGEGGEGGWVGQI